MSLKQIMFLKHFKFHHISHCFIKKKTEKLKYNEKRVAAAAYNPILEDITVHELKKASMEKLPERKDYPQLKIMYGQKNRCPKNIGSRSPCAF